jgi:hypothetical protein
MMRAWASAGSASQMRDSAQLTSFATSRPSNLNPLLRKSLVTSSVTGAVEMMDPFSKAEFTRDQERDPLSSTEASLDVDEVGPR